MFNTGLINARVRYSLKGDTEEYMCVVMMRSTFCGESGIII